MNWSDAPRAVHTTAPDGTTFTGATTLNPAICCVLWQQDPSTGRWVRCSDFIAYSQVNSHRPEPPPGGGWPRCALTPARLTP